MKGIIGRTLATLLLAPGLPMMAILAVCVRLSSPGPAVYRQSRVGRNGRVFVMYKFRTMIPDAEAQTGPAWSCVDDPRITRLGRVMRRLHMDELPQLFNVLKGEMNLIGPRPERPEIVDVLATKIPPYRERLRIAPGITGLAQINLPPDTDLDDVRRKLMLDLAYIHDLSPILDLRIFLCSVLRIVGVPGEVAMQMMRLQRKVPLPGAGMYSEDPQSVSFGINASNGVIGSNGLDVSNGSDGSKAAGAAVTSTLGRHTASRNGQERHAENRNGSDPSQARKRNDIVD